MTLELKERMNDSAWNKGAVQKGQFDDREKAGHDGCKCFTNVSKDSECEWLHSESFDKAYNFLFFCSIYRNMNIIKPEFTMSTPLGWLIHKGS